MYTKLATVLALSHLASASVSVYDPSDDFDIGADAYDNSILLDWDITPSMTQLIATTGPYYYSGVDKNISHGIFYVDANDTSVIVITEDSIVDLEYATVIKYGFPTNIYQTSFFGVNAAINVANGSTAYISKTNITVHNGAANIYSYGSDTYVYASDLWLYSSGPVAHGLYAGGNGTIYANNIAHYSGGYRSSAFAGDDPAGWVYVNDSVAHTAGLGSAIFYVLGYIEAHNVVGYTERAPVLFMDSDQSVVIYNSDLTAGFLGGIVSFSSSDKNSGASVKFIDSILATENDIACLTFGNVVADVEITRTELKPSNGVLVSANTSQVTQDFDEFIVSGSGDAIVTVSESVLTGDLLAINGSTIQWYLEDYSYWTGSVVIQEETSTDVTGFGVYLDETSTWVLTGDQTLVNFTDAVANLSNIIDNGYSIYYDESSDVNSWLDGATISLSGGGSVAPSS